MSKQSSILAKATRFARTALPVLAVAALSQTALAAGGFSNEINSMATNIRTAIYTFVGIVAGIIVLWQCLEGAQGRKQWGDILHTCLWVVGAAASIALVTWLWTRGGSLTFG